MKEIISGFHTTKIAWPEHFTNGGTGVTKLGASRLVEVAETVKAFGDPEVWIEGDALHTRLRDLSAFWDLDKKLHPNP